MNATCVPCQTSKMFKQHLGEQNIAVLDWAGNSADLIPMENQWSHMKDKCLIREFKTLWTQMDNNYLVSLAKSMPRCLELVIKAKGQIKKTVEVINIQSFEKFRFFAFHWDNRFPLW